MSFHRLSCIPIRLLSIMNPPRPTIALQAGHTNRYRRPASPGIMSPACLAEPYPAARTEARAGKRIRMLLRAVNHPAGRAIVGRLSQLNGDCTITSHGRIHLCRYIQVAGVPAGTVQLPITPAAGLLFHVIAFIPCMIANFKSDALCVGKSGTCRNQADLRAFDLIRQMR